MYKVTAVMSENVSQKTLRTTVLLATADSTASSIGTVVVSQCSLCV